MRNEDGPTADQINPAETRDLRSIMREERNEELAEQSEKRHGVNGAVGVGKEDGQKHDELFVNTFIDTKVAAKFKSVLRLGKPDPIKKRPIMVIFHSEQEKENMRNLGNLKDNKV